VSDVAKAVTACAEAARDGARSLPGARDEAIDEALRGMATLLAEAAVRLRAPALAASPHAVTAAATSDTCMSLDECRPGAPAR